MLRESRLVYVIFCCQQAIEKALKAHIDERGDDPPYIHSLIKLRRLHSLMAGFPLTMTFSEKSRHITFKAGMLLK